MRNVAVNVREAVVPGSGHWLMEEKCGLHRRLDSRLFEGAPQPLQFPIVKASISGAVQHLVDRPVDWMNGSSTEI